MDRRELELIMNALYIVMDRDFLSESEWEECDVLLKKLEENYE